MSSSSTRYNTSSSSTGSGSRSAYDWEKAFNNPYAKYDEPAFERNSYQARRTNSTSSNRSYDQSPTSPTGRSVRFSIDGGSSKK